MKLNLKTKTILVACCVLVAALVMILGDRAMSQDRALGYAKKVESGQENKHLSPPFLVVDLDGDGIDLIPLEESQVYFDVDGDGLAERTAWVKPSDGILMILPPELYEKKSSVLDKVVTISTNAFGDLDSYDANNNQSYDMDDRIKLYGKDTWPAGLKLWIDKNHNGFPEKGEREKSYTDSSLQSLTVTQEKYEQPFLVVESVANLITSDGQYKVYQVRFNYEDSNVIWDSFCASLEYSGAGFSGSEDKDQIRCLEQGYKPQGPWNTHVWEEYKKGNGG